MFFCEFHREENKIPVRIIKIIDEKTSTFPAFFRLMPNVPYLTQADRIETNVSKLRDRKFYSTSVFSSFNLDEIQIQFASMYFKVEANKARQLLVEQPLLEAISTFDRDKIKEIEGVAGFSDVCEETIQNAAWVNSEPANIVLAAHTLFEAKIESGHKNRIWEKLCKDFLNAKKIDEWYPVMGSGMCCLVMNSVSEKRESVVKQAVVLSMQTVKTKTKDNETPIVELGEWFNSLSSLFPALERAGFKDYLESNFKIPSDIDSYLNLATSLAPKDLESATDVSFGASENYAYLIPEAEPQEVINAIKKKVSEGTFKEEDSHALLVMLRSKTNWKLGELLDVCISRLQTTPNNQPNLNLEEVRGLLSGLLVIVDMKTIEEAQAKLSDLTKHSVIQHYYQLAVQQQDLATAALCSYLLMMYNTSSEMPRALGQSSVGKVEFIKFLTKKESRSDTNLTPFINVAKRFSTTECLISVVKKDSNAEAMAGICLEAMVSDDESILRYVKSTDVTQSYRNLKRLASDESLDDICRVLAKESGLIGKTIETGFDPGLSDLYTRLLALQAEDLDSLIGFVKKGLEELDESTWTKNLTIKGNGIEKLVVEMARRDTADLSLGVPYFDALMTFTKSKMVAEGKSPSFYANDIKMMLKPTSSHNLNSFIDKLWNYLATLDSTSETNDGGGLLSIYSDFMPTSKSFARDVDRFVGSYFDGAIKRCDLNELDSVSSYVTKNKVLQLAGSDTQKSLLDRIASVKKSLEAEIKNLGEEEGTETTKKLQLLDKIADQLVTEEKGVLGLFGIGGKKKKSKQT